jgi:hypothetical protein
MFMSLYIYTTRFNSFTDRNLCRYQHSQSINMYITVSIGQMNIYLSVGIFIGKYNISPT